MTESPFIKLHSQIWKVKVTCTHSQSDCGTLYCQRSDQLLYSVWEARGDNLDKGYVSESFCQYYLQNDLYIIHLIYLG